MITTAADDDDDYYYFYYYDLPTVTLVSMKFREITGYVTGPIALVTNGLLLIVFARMYRAKQQVITVRVRFSPAGKLRFLPRDAMPALH